MTASRSLLGRKADAIALAVVYALVLLAFYFFLDRVLRDSPGLPNLREGLSIALLSLVPAALLGVIAVTLRRFVIEYRKRVFGTRLRLRVFLLISACMFMAGLPPALLLGRLAARAVSMPASKAVRSALVDGMDFTLEYYAKCAASLQGLAEREWRRLPEATREDPARAMSALSAIEAAVCSVETFFAGGGQRFSGDAAGRNPGAAALPPEPGFLAKRWSGGAGYLGYWTGFEDGTGAVITVRFPPEREAASLTVSDARNLAESLESLGPDMFLYLAIFYGIIVFPLLLIAALFAFSATDHLLRPLSALEEATKLVSGGDYRIRLLSKPRDEMGNLLRSFNDMLLDLERGRDVALRSEKISVWRDIAQRLAHELRNPLTPIRLSAERVLRRHAADPGSSGEILEKSMLAIIEEVSGMDALLSEFRDFARLPEPQKDWARLRAIVEETCVLYSASFPELRFDTGAVDADTVLRVDRSAIKQALGNLVLNAAASIREKAGTSGDARDAPADGPKGTIAFRSDLVKTADYQYCRLQVRDSGGGIPLEVRDRIFTPYFTTKPDGTGLGLAVVEHIVTAHGGRIWFDSTEGVGTVFYVDLPMGNGKDPAT